MTVDTASLTSKLAAMEPVGNTNISLGTEFGWNLLDPQLPVITSYSIHYTKLYEPEIAEARPPIS